MRRWVWMVVVLVAVVVMALSGARIAASHEDTDWNWVYGTCDGWRYSNDPDPNGPWEGPHCWTDWSTWYNPDEACEAGDTPPDFHDQYCVPHRFYWGGF